MHEIFDEYYSVSRSFWTKMGPREKARQGLLTGSLPWGYVRGADGIASRDAARAPALPQLFEMYATGQQSNRTLAVWLTSTSTEARAVRCSARTPCATCSATLPTAGT